MKLHLFPGTPLYRESKRGHFDPMTPEEILREEYLLLENLTVKDCLFEDTTVLNTYSCAEDFRNKKKNCCTRWNTYLRWQTHRILFYKQRIS